MKTALLILLFFIQAIPSNAQNAETERLQKILSAHPQQDTFRVNRLNELAFSSLIPSREKEKLANEALSIARKTSYAEGEGHALIHLASVQYAQGSMRESDSMYRQAEAIAKKTGNQELLANALWQIGRNLGLADSKEALGYLLQAEAAAEKSGNKKLLSDCQRTTGYFYQVTLSDYPRAVDYNLKAIRSAEEANYSEGLIWG